jgi:hypothetical protein
MRWSELPEAGQKLIAFLIGKPNLSCSVTKLSQVCSLTVALGFMLGRPWTGPQWKFLALCRRVKGRLGDVV